MSDPLRIIVVDDHPVFRMGLVALLSSIDGLEVVAQAESLATAIDADVAIEGRRLRELAVKGRLGHRFLGQRGRALEHAFSVDAEIRSMTLLQPSHPERNIQAEEAPLVRG